MEYQVNELGADSIKFYQAQAPGQAWRADDRALAYPLWEKAQELGVKMLQFHKGLPLGHQRVEDLAPNDIQLAAFDFPELNWGLHHLGHPYVDETIDIASRFENVYLILPLLFNQYFVQPMEMMHRLGKALFYCGDDRLCYGSDGFVWPYFQAYIDLIAELEMPIELQEGYGYPEITDDTRRRSSARTTRRAWGWTWMSSCPLRPRGRGDAAAAGGDSRRAGRGVARPRPLAPASPRRRRLGGGDPGRGGDDRVAWRVQVVPGRRSHLRRRRGADRAGG